MMLQMIEPARDPIGVAIPLLSDPALGWLPANHLTLMTITRIRVPAGGGKTDRSQRVAAPKNTLTNGISSGRNFGARNFKDRDLSERGIERE
jgi:hypothetical protein